MVTLISIESGSYATGLMFEPIESRTKSNNIEKNWSDIYVFNLEVWDLIEYIDLLNWELSYGSYEIKHWLCATSIVHEAQVWFRRWIDQINISSNYERLNSSPNYFRSDLN